MLSRDQLKLLSEHIEDESAEFGRRSALARGLPFYGALKTQFPEHWSSFSHMHGRVNKSRLECDFPRTVDGFIEFIIYLGDVPCDMDEPTIGRKDHNVGYIRNNFSWQSKSVNSSEVGARVIETVRASCQSTLKSSRLQEVLKSGEAYNLTRLFELSGYSYRKNLYQALRELNVEFDIDKDSFKVL